MSRCSTPNLCCSSIITSARFVGLKLAEKAACVATIIAGSPLATFASALRLLASFIPPVMSVISTFSPARSIICCRFVACCDANTCVGAISTAWCPEPTTCSIALIATIVFPEPTSPCKRRRIGFNSDSLVACDSPCISAVISLITFFCPSVSSNGRLSSKRFLSSLFSHVYALFSPDFLRDCKTAICDMNASS
ncbi:Uncharacterised protein [Chlamydia trachomatis]|nr:Uncharacterised protein [Chlamydia trachomatis]